MIVEVNNLVGANCITLEDGEKVFEKIYAELKGNRAVEIDFKDVKLFASPFFNAAIGQLYRDFTSEELNRLVKISGLTPNGSVVLRKVIANARSYYSSAKVKSAVDSAVDKRGEAKGS